jgi:ergothioneine biosynthesis protein EgtB
MDGEVSRRIVLGLNHEQQHQELALTDIKHAFFSNPIHPVYGSSGASRTQPSSVPNLGWCKFSGDLVDIGHIPNLEDPFDFCFDNEAPRHRVFLEPFEFASREVTCREYLEFMADDGYLRSELWLSDGWDAAQTNKWQAPLYWERDPSEETGWRVFTLNGWKRLSELLDVPVCHVSFYEADAFARWRGCRLPTETEWELVASQLPRHGNLLDTARLHPSRATESGVTQIFGDCWEWTSSPYTAYPGYKRPPGALGEYNGKFMTNQMILRGGSCVTPADHVRATYRNFFYPTARWQFTGIRLAI